MGAGASTKVEEFGPFGDINQVKSLCVELGEDFDEAKFNELKDADGYVTQEQLQELFKEKQVPTNDLVASGAEEVEVTPPGPIIIPLTELDASVKIAVMKGLTPLIVDPSENHVVDTFYQYNAVMIDAKQLSLNVAMKKMSKEEALEKARTGLVSALQQGQTMVVSMQQGVPSFDDWFDTPTEWPMNAIAHQAGKPLTVQDEATKEFGAGIPKAVMREADTARHSGFAIVQEKFQVVFTTWFQAEDFEEFLFGDGKALSKLGKDTFQVIIISE